RSVHLPLQTAPVHVEVVQTPSTQLSPAGQTDPHNPQLFGSLVVSTHLPLQIAPVHVEVVQRPCTQLSPEGQTLPHPPQLFGSLAVEAQPEGQHDCPAAHTGPPSHLVMQTLTWQSAPEGQT